MRRLCITVTLILLLATPARAQHVVIDPGNHVQAVLIEPDGAGRTAYLLTGNYRVILDYNCSNFYALSVGLLADEIVR